MLSWPVDICSSRRADARRHGRVLQPISAAATTHRASEGLIRGGASYVRFTSIRDIQSLATHVGSGSGRERAPVGRNDDGRVRAVALPWVHFGPMSPASMGRTGSSPAGPRTNGREPRTENQLAVDCVDCEAAGSRLSTTEISKRRVPPGARLIM
jgi:hypothetical protein